MSNLINKYIYFPFLDGDDFSISNSYYCESAFQTHRGLAEAAAKCRNNINCAMLSSLECEDELSEYRLCEISTNLIPNVDACTFWKMGNIMNIYNFMIDL